MKKYLIILSLIGVVSMSGPGIAVGDSESGDLCGGTGGVGQIISVENDSFSIQRPDRANLIVKLANGAAITTPAGNISLSDLKIGSRVTLVGGPNPDGSFTADTVVVCNGTDEIRTNNNGSSQATPLTVRNGNSEEYEKVNGLVSMATILFVGLVWLGIVVFLLRKKKKNFVYILFFTVFCLYLYKVLDYTLLQFQSLLLIRHFVPGLILNGFKDGTNLNLIPLATLTSEDIKASLLNVLMMVPFGFGLPFIVNFRIKKVVIISVFFSAAIELLQLVTGFAARTTFRVADINDVIFNVLGVIAGYILFVVFVRIYRRISGNWKNPILRYIADRPQIDKIY
jgi:glycopeptide antibiotics resistance protein